MTPAETGFGGWLAKNLIANAEKMIGHQRECTVDLAVSPLCQDNVNFVDFMGRPLYQPRRPSIKPHKVPAIFAQYLSGPILLVNITLAFKRVGSEMTLGGPW